MNDNQQVNNTTNSQQLAADSAQQTVAQPVSQGVVAQPTAQPVINSMQPTVQQPLPEVDQPMAETTSNLSTGQVGNQQSGLSSSGEIEELREKIAKSAVPQSMRDRLNGMIDRLLKMSLAEGFSKEFEPVSNYINWATQIPWGKFSEDNLEINHAIDSLTRYHFGLLPVKQRILEYLAVVHMQAKQGIAGNIVTKENIGTDQSQEMKKLQGNSSHAPVLCFVGIQGVGKTSMAKSIAIALNRPFVRIALGGLGSVTELRGRSRGTVDAEPGQIIKSLISSKSMNPLILLDEIDKVSSDSGLRADVMAALLEILDPEQNSTFIDKYLDYPVDLSKCMFITTANNLGGISAALLDRLEVIRFGSYTDTEKVTICRDYLLPKVREATGLSKQQLDFAPDVWPLVIRPFGFDAGVRQLERTITELARKVAFQIVTNPNAGDVLITKDNFRQYIPEDIGVYS